MPSRFFPSAREARFNSRNNLEIFREIRTIEEHILVAQSNGLFEVVVDDTVMTEYPATGVQNPADSPSLDFYNTWKGAASVSLEEQMKTVIGYFKDLGYSIVRRAVNNSTTFTWVIKW